MLNAISLYRKIKYYITFYIESKIVQLIEAKAEWWLLSILGVEERVLGK